MGWNLQIILLGYVWFPKIHEGKCEEKRKVERRIKNRFKINKLFYMLF